MTLVDDDIAAARRAVSTVERLASTLVQHYGDSVDARRLLADVGRLGTDLDLLCGQAVRAPAPPAPPPPPTPVREVIADTAYAHDFWMDAEDEGVGRYDGRGR